MVSSSCDVAVWIGWYNAFVNRVAWFSFCAFPPILWNGECTKWYLICCISSAVATTHNRASLPVAALRCQMHAGGRWASQQSSSLFFPLVHLGPWKYNIFLSIVFHVLLPNKPNLDFFFVMDSSLKATIMHIQINYHKALCHSVAVRNKIHFRLASYALAAHARIPLTRFFLFICNRA